MKPSREDSAMGDDLYLRPWDINAQRKLLQEMEAGLTERYDEGIAIQAQETRDRIAWLKSGGKEGKL
jgi:hypothetical protein